MNERDRVDRISAYVTSELARGRGRSGIGIEEDLLETGVLDSISIVRLVAFVEQTFDIEVLDEDLAPQNFQTIAKIAAYVGRRLTAEKHASSAA